MVLARVDSVAYGGYGVARIDGFVHFVPDTAPGDVVEIRPVSRKKRYGFSQLVRIIEPSPWRVEPFCLYYGECGGCNLQHIEYSQQLEIKKNIILDQLARVGKIPVVPEPGIQGSETKRIRMRFQVRDGVVGLFKRKTHSVCPIHHCGVASETVNAILQRLQAFEFKEPLTRNGKITVLASPSEALISITLPDQEARRLYNDLGEHVKGCTILARNKRLVLGKAYLDIDMLGLQFAVPADSFWQVNPEINEIMVKQICDFMQGANRVLDIYCGCGNMTLPLSRVCKEVIGIEKNTSSIEAAHHSLSRAGIGNVEFVSSDAAEAELGTMDGLVLDPPRLGLQGPLLEKIENSRPRKIAYVSCNPSTLARDLQRMIEMGYSIRSVQLLDMFPHTHHIESLTLMQYSD